MRNWQNTVLGGGFSKPPTENPKGGFRHPQRPARRHAMQNSAGGEGRFTQKALHLQKLPQRPRPRGCGLYI